MKILIAIDSFKGSLTSLEAGNAVKNGIKRAIPNAQVQVGMLADGGEGTVEALTFAKQGKLINVKAHGPKHKIVTAQYGFVKKEQLAIIEMSKASGITLLKKNELNPLYTSTYGVGELIIDALNKGVKKFIVGIGGSATNDGGVGMLTKLGYEFLDKNNKPIKLGAIGLKDLAKIKTNKVDKRLKKCSFLVASDVNNPLCGKLGCSAIFGPQKGATSTMVKDMDKWLSNYGLLTEKLFNKKTMNAKGAGAAGGLGFALISYLNANLKPGIEIVLSSIKLEDKIKKVDVVVTGEGKLDAQTAMGKAPIGVARLAKKYNKFVIAFAGSIGEGANVLNQHGIDAYFAINNKPISLETAMKKNVASSNLTNTANQVFNIIKER